LAKAARIRRRTAWPLWLPRLSRDCQIELEVPRDRQARFDLQLIAKYQRRFPGFDDKIISMYARYMSTREIVAHLHEL
jgi:transposase-like protein